MARWTSAQLEMFQKKPRSSKIDPNGKSYDFSHPSFDYSLNKILVGFDPSTKECGFAVFHPDDGLLEFEDITTHLMKSYVLDLIRQYNGDLHFRVEIPTERTAYGVAKRMAASMANTNKSRESRERAFFGIVWKSARCNEIANQLVIVLKEMKCSYELVDSSMRKRYDGDYYKTLDDTKLQKVMKKDMMQRADKRLFPSKVKKSVVEKIFGVVGQMKSNVEYLDAAMLLYPEIMIKKNLKS